MNKSLVLLSVLALISCTDNKQITFTEYAENPVVLSPDKGTWDAGALGTPSVLKVGETFHMYYEAWGSLSDNGSQDEYSSLQIGHATSSDGIHWTKDTNNPILPLGKKGEWDEDGTWDPFVIYEDEIYKMWYGGGIGESCNWGYAESKNGSNFVKKGKISDLGNLEDIHVVHNEEDRKYYLFYWNRAEAPWGHIMDSIPPQPSGLFVAVSENETDFDFKNAKKIQIKGQEWPAKYSHVIRHNEQWIMFYGEAVTRGNPSCTGIAVSKDLYNWEKLIFPVVQGHDAEILKLSDNLWYLYYAPYSYFDMPDCDIRLAIYKGRI